MPLPPTLGHRHLLADPKQALTALQDALRQLRRVHFANPLHSSTHTSYLAESATLAEMPAEVKIQWSVELVQDMLEIIASSRDFRQGIFSQNTIGKLLIWKATRDVCIQLFTEKKEVLWFKEQEKIGRVKKTGAGWEATAEWKGGFKDPVKSKIESLKNAYKKSQTCGDMESSWKSWADIHSATKRRLLKQLYPWYFTMYDLSSGTGGDEPELPAYMTQAAIEPAPVAGPSRSAGAKRKQGDTNAIAVDSEDDDKVKVKRIMRERLTPGPAPVHIPRGVKAVSDLPDIKPSVYPAPQTAIPDHRSARHLTKSRAVKEEPRDYDESSAPDSSPPRIVSRAPPAPVQVFPSAPAVNGSAHEPIVVTDSSDQEMSSTSDGSDSDDSDSPITPSARRAAIAGDVSYANVQPARSGVTGVSSIGAGAKVENGAASDPTSDSDTDSDTDSSASSDSATSTDEPGAYGIAESSNEPESSAPSGLNGTAKGHVEPTNIASIFPPRELTVKARRAACRTALEQLLYVRKQVVPPVEERLAVNAQFREDKTAFSENKRVLSLLTEHCRLAANGYTMKLLTLSAVMFPKYVGAEWNKKMRMRCEILKKVIRGCGGIVISEHDPWPENRQRRIITLDKHLSEDKKVYYDTAESFIRWHDKRFIATFGEDDIEAILLKGLAPRRFRMS